ncbi:MAG TPA: hypothetical protein VLJ68_09615 [Chitinophagaceae bacterium]|nr:hypothetical protein [Chitinophagaceae bacterium]
MKHKIAHAHREAKIYRHHYKPSLNLFRFLKSILGIFISGTSPAANSFYNRK